MRWEDTDVTIVVKQNVHLLGRFMEECTRVTLEEDLIKCLFTEEICSH